MRSMSLSEAYLAGRDGEGPADLERLLEAACAAARSEWPTLTIDEHELVTALARLETPLAPLAAGAVAELAVALGCARGDARALEAFDRRWLQAIPAMIAHMKLGETMVDEVVQATRTKLLVPREAGAPLPLLAYAGQGKLAGLLKVTAVRTAISLLRKERPGPEQETSDLAAEHDPELSFLKAAYRAAFREAFEKAVLALEPRDKNLLKLHFLSKMTLEALARMYGVHRATIVRQLASVREKLATATRRELIAKLGARSSEIDSIMELVTSRFDVSVERMLRTIEEPPAHDGSSTKS
jgi:RNA polymerase sigma-70 factor (ECF subfamily)